MVTDRIDEGTTVRHLGDYRRLHEGRMTVVRRIEPTEGMKLRALRLQALAESPLAFGSTLAETESRGVEYWDMRASQSAGGDESALFVAEDKGGWVGLAGGGLKDSDGVRQAEVISMWVSPAHRHRGVGRRLIDRVIEWARDHGAVRVVLWVTETNSAAKALYLRCGFAGSGDTQPLPSHPALKEELMVLDL